MVKDALELRLRHLETKEAIHDLLAAFGRALDAFDEAALRRIVTPDIELRHEAVGPPMQSSAALIASLTLCKPRLRAMQHFITNATFDLLEADRAVVRASVLVMHEVKGGGPPSGRLVPAGGTYTMQVVQTSPGLWQIQRLDVEESWFDERIAEIYAEPGADPTRSGDDPLDAEPADGALGTAEHVAAMIHSPPDRQHVQNPF